MENSNNISKALKEEKELIQASKDISEISEKEKDLMRDILKGAFF